MRSCPVCSSESRQVVWRMDFVIPDNWTRPPFLDWCQCECGMIYGDHPDANQKMYDQYYIERYGYGVEDAAAIMRLEDRANYINVHFHNKGIKIVDFGGGDGGLKHMLSARGFDNVITFGCGDTLPDNVDVIIAEHVIEHIYGVHHAMKSIMKALKPGGILIIDIPDAGLFAIERPEEAPILDFSQVHINHFRMLDMLRLANNYDFELIETRDYHERMGGCRMYVFSKDKLIISRRSRWFVERNIAEKMNKLRELGNKEVAVWGFGDIAAHCLAKVHINVKYFICNDPAFKGQRIHGLPIFEEPQSDIPIVVIAQSQKGLLLERIKLAGYKNEVIVI